MSRSITQRMGAVLGVLALGATMAIATAVPASAAGNIDPATPVSLTIHKHALGPSTPLNPVSNGQQLATPPAQPLSGAQFTASLVQGVDLMTTAGWTQAGQMTPAQAAQRVSTQTFTSLESRPDGIAVFEETMPKGLYLIRETKLPTGATNPAADFLVTLPLPSSNNGGSAANQWVYDVHVYPKNAVTALTKTRIPAAAGSVEARNPDLVRWAIGSSIPTLAAGDAINTFTMSDTIPAELAYLTASTLPAGVAPTSVTVADANGVAQPFVEGPTADYEITTSGSTSTLAFTTAGRNKLTALQGGTVTFNIITRAVAIPASGVIVNNASAVINGATTATTGSTPIGQLTVFAYSNDGARTPLANAEYRVFLTEQDAINNTNPITIGTATSWPTGADGIVQIPIMTPGNYWVRETAPPVGFQLPSPDRILTAVVAGPTSTVEPVRNYVEFGHNQVPAWTLPITGGDGGVWFGIGGAALLTVMVGGALVVARRRAQTARVSA